MADVADVALAGDVKGDGRAGQAVLVRGIEICAATPVTGHGSAIATAQRFKVTDTRTFPIGAMRSPSSTFVGHDQTGWRSVSAMKGCATPDSTASGWPSVQLQVTLLPYHFRGEGSREQNG